MGFSTIKLVIEMISSCPFCLTTIILDMEACMGNRFCKKRSCVSYYAVVVVPKKIVNTV